MVTEGWRPQTQQDHLRSGGGRRGDDEEAIKVTFGVVPYFNILHDEDGCRP